MPDRPHFPGMERRTQINVGYLIFAFFAMLLLQQWWQTAQTVEVVPYSEFEKETLVEAELADLRRSLGAPPQPAPA